MMLHHKVDDDFRITKFYGITQDPVTENYVMVLKYANDGSLRKYLDIKYYELNWKSIFRHLDDIVSGLNFIHKKELIHRDLHIGNMLKHENNVAITDMGLCKPANCNLSKNNIYGILPYIAPEILGGQNYTKAADIYSFGINMYELISGLPPYYDLSHDNYLAIKICQGLRPRFNIKVPQLIVQLIKRCLDANQLNRPTAIEVINILRKWQYKESDNETVELQKQIKETEKINNNSRVHIKPSTSLGISYKSHSGAIYTSRLLSFNNLPEPKNSVDYYEQIDNIISKEFSESLQINISQLNINENESSQINISQLNIEEDNQNSESESKRKNCFLSQNDESESKRKKIRIE
ncbi:Ypk2p [Rhizophagus irregularis DAOM 197198w]|uniref:Ypk2p n=1 Tax=Rhizophagus irregularis (strain DAOM 197198w) TaxID=1432141 RepID=A0A015KA64_RHIIW|nr:Ypk2p [Rhizophagus irregularis DAOM 197198w]